MAQKMRLDVLLARRQLALSRSKAAAMIMAGEVLVNGQPAQKPGTSVPCDAEISLKAKARYVSRGGIKLQAALEAFPLQPAGKVCADVGASTGGFTDCLLQHGAARVYALDVGRGIIDYRLRQDARVILLEGRNARYVELLPEQPQLVVIDVSFISLRHILPAVRAWMSSGADVLALVKPQFEVGRAQVGRGGVVRDRQLHEQVLRRVTRDAASCRFAPQAVMRSPITGAKGNREFLLWLRAVESGSSGAFEQEITALFAPRP